MAQIHNKGFRSFTKCIPRLSFRKRRAGTPHTHTPGAVATGFTLIELLVVIAIIGLLSSIILASLNSARAKANDAKIRTDLHNLTLALQLYYDKNGSMPPNPPPATSGAPASTALLPLVTQGFISSIPVSPNPSYSYYYYDYGAGNSIGGIIVSQLQGTPVSTGYAGSCRPWAPNANWCDSSSNTYYCLCNPY